MPLKEIGFWSTLDGLNPELPDACSAPIRPTTPSPSFVHSLLPNHNRAPCVVHSIEHGVSLCRICGAPNGCANLTNGVYIWPEGLVHYIVDHGLVLEGEEAFVASLERFVCVSGVRKLPPTNELEGELDVFVSPNLPSPFSLILDPPPPASAPPS